MYRIDDFAPGVPIYVQIMEKIKLKIISGEMGPGDRIPAVRELANLFGVNPNTTQRALAELEREGLLYAERTAGRYITQNMQLITAVRDTRARELTQAFAQQMMQMGYNHRQITEMIDREVINDEQAH